MPAAPLLDDDEIKAALLELSDWRLEGNRLLRTLQFEDFSTALAFVGRVAAAADEMDHHPDVAIHWGDLTLALWTHAAGGITQRDLRLARAIDALALSR